MTENEWVEFKYSATRKYLVKIIFGYFKSCLNYHKKCSWVVTLNDLKGLNFYNYVYFYFRIICLPKDNSAVTHVDELENDVSEEESKLDPHAEELKVIFI